MAAREVETVPSDSSSDAGGLTSERSELLPFLTFGSRGIRPQGELDRLEWRDIDLVDRVVGIFLFSGL